MCVGCKVSVCILFVVYRVMLHGVDFVFLCVLYLCVMLHGLISYLFVCAVFVCDCALLIMRVCVGLRYMV